MSSRSTNRMTPLEYFIFALYILFFGTFVEMFSCFLNFPQGALSMV